MRASSSRDERSSAERGSSTRVASSVQEKREPARPLRGDISGIFLLYEFEERLDLFARTYKLLRAHLPFEANPFVELLFAPAIVKPSS